MSELQIVNSGISDINNKPKKKKKKIVSAFLVFVILVIGYLIVNIIISYGNSYSVYTVNRGEFEDIITVEGYLFRDQHIINSPATGFLDCRVAENERIAKGTEVASVYNKMPSDEVSTKLKKLDDEIAKLSTIKIKETAYKSHDLSQGQEYASEIKSAVACGYSKDFVGLADVADEMIREIRKSQLADKDSENLEDEKVDVNEVLVTELRAQRDKLISENSITSVPVISTATGVFSSKIDGLEQSLSVDKLNGLTPSYIKNLTQIKKEQSSNAEKGNPVCKIVNNFEWYYATVISTKDAESLTVNQNVKLRFFDITSNMITGNVSYISADENGETVIVIKSNKYVDSIYTLSKTNADIVKSIYSGLKIPTDGIRVVDNKTGVYVRRHGVARFVTADVIHSDGKWAIISENGENDGSKIKLYDELILNARNLYDGKILD